MKNVKYAIFFLIISLSLNACSQNIISGKEQLDFLKWEVKTNNSPKGITVVVDSILLTNGNVNIDFLNNKLVFFSKKDIEFMQKQLNNESNSVVWNNENFPESRIILDRNLNEIFEKENAWQEFRGKNGEGYYNYSLPLFSLDRTMVVLFKNYQCGLTCGFSETVIYKKKGDAWGKLTTLSKGHK